MITIFNRKRLFSSFSVKGSGKPAGSPGGPQDSLYRQCGQYSRRLCRADIRAAAGGAGLNLDYAYEYVIYVRKKDYQRAEDLLRAQIG